MGVRSIEERLKKLLLRNNNLSLLFHVLNWLLCWETWNFTIHFEVPQPLFNFVHFYFLFFIFTSFHNFTIFFLLDNYKDTIVQRVFKYSIHHFLKEKIFEIFSILFFLDIFFFVEINKIWELRLIKKNDFRKVTRRSEFLNVIFSNEFIVRRTINLKV